MPTTPTSTWRRRTVKRAIWTRRWPRRARRCAWSRNPPAPAREAQLHLLRQEEAAALADLDEAVRLQPADAPPAERAADQLERGRLLYRMKNYEDAIRACQAVRAARDDSAAAQRLEGEALVRLKRFREAVACFDRSLEGRNARPDAGAYWERGLARLEINDPAGAAEDFTEALALETSAADRRKLRLCAAGRTCWSGRRGWPCAISTRPRRPGGPRRRRPRPMTGGGRPELSSASAGRP